MSRLNPLLAAASLVLAAGPALASTPAKVPAKASDGAWPSYNRTLTSERFSPLAEINRKTVGKLKVICSYDTGDQLAFQSGLIEVGGALYGTAGSDTFSLDPDRCTVNWRIHEAVAPGFLKVNRGLAYMDGGCSGASPTGR